MEEVNSFKCNNCGWVGLEKELYEEDGEGLCPICESIDIKRAKIKPKEDK